MGFQNIILELRLDLCNCVLVIASQTRVQSGPRFPQVCYSYFIINIYRSFNPNGLTQREQFLIQCEKISLACNKDTIIIGDMNLDYNRRDDVNYQYGQLFEVFNDKLSRFNLLQLVNFDTWFRTVGAVNRSSCLDHI